MIVQLQDVCEKKTSNIRQKDLKDKVGKYPIYGASGFIKNVDFYHQSKKYVAVVKDGAGIGRAMLLPANSSVIGTVQYLIPKENVLPEYLYYVVKNMHLEKYFTGATIPHIYFKDYKTEQFNLVSIKQQKELVKLFNKIMNTINYRKEELAKLDILIKARFVEMFGNLTINDKKWETMDLDSVFNSITSSKRILKSQWRDKGIPFLRVRDLVQLAENNALNNEFFISKDLYSELSDKDGVPKRGDILVSATSTLGKCHIVLSNEQFYFKDADILRFRPSDKINAVFFKECMNDNFIKGQINKTLGVTTVKHFTIKAAKTIFIRIPPLSLQNKFAEFVQQVDKLSV